jgi:hypothetical protein
MRKAARIVGVIWVMAVIAGYAVVTASGRLHGGRGEMFVLFAAALPGIFLFRWGREPGSHDEALARRLRRDLARRRPPR